MTLAWRTAIVSAATLALLLARFGTDPALAAYAWLAVTGVLLAEADLEVQRLPNHLTLPAYPAMVVLLALAAWAGDSWGQLGRALLGGLALGTVYLMLALLGPMGGGDVKLAGLLGMALGWLGWRDLAYGASLGWVLAAAAGLWQLARGKVTRRSMISFGPFMLLGALIVIAGTA